LENFIIERNGNFVGVLIGLLS